MLVTPPRIVFFGLPRTGKTGLLHAFLGTVPLATVESHQQPEVTPHIDPNAQCILCDVDGFSASQLIDNPSQLQFPQRPVAGEVLSADAIIVALDATATKPEMTELFRSFGQFLDGLERTRENDREVAGLPIFLTLTKCDSLCLPNDNPASWIRKIEAQKENVKTAFEDFLDEETAFGSATNPVPQFGSINVQVAATALRFPRYTLFASFQSESYGVAELYREAIDAANDFRTRTAQSRKRLRQTVAGASTLLSSMLLGLIALLIFSSQTSDDRLTLRLRAYQEREGTAALRLADRSIAKNRSELTAIHEDLGYERLADEDRVFVDARLREFKEYADYRERFHMPRLGPAEVRSKYELDVLDTELRTLLMPPPDYAAAWMDTEAVRLWNKWKTDAELLRRAEGTLNEWYRGLVRRGTVLMLVPGIDHRWRLDVLALQAEAGAPPFRPTDDLPGSEKLPNRRGAVLNYGAAFEFDRVDQARSDWESTRERLVHLRDLCAALGMTPGPGVPAAVLDLPEPNADGGGSRGLAEERTKQLADLYQRRLENAYEWEAARFPDPVRGEVQKRLRRSYDTGVRHVRGLILNRLNRADTRPAWLEVAGWADEPEIRSWGRFLQQLARWDGDLPPDDPIVELIAFLKRDRFDADAKQLELMIPDDLRNQRAVPSGKLVITVAAKEYAYRIEGEPDRTGPASTFRLTADGHDGKFSVRLNDDVTATLTLRSGGQDFQLEWTSSRSAVYRFDRLNSEPKLRKDGATERAIGVRLMAIPEAGFPAAPILMPDAIHP